MGICATKAIEVSVKQTIHPITDQHHRKGTSNGIEFYGWDYEEGWLISSPSISRGSGELLWVYGTSSAPCFHSVSSMEPVDQSAVEIEVEPMEVTLAEKTAILGMFWQWEIWEPITIAGTCAIDCLERMLDLSRDVLLDWFRTAGRNPSVLEHIVETLKENGYAVDITGPEGFGRFRGFRRLVSMLRKDDPTKGHVVLIYEHDQAIFDSSGVFKRVGDIVWSDRLGYNRGAVLRIENKQV
jgi:hypothetical protein